MNSPDLADPSGRRRLLIVDDHPIVRQGLSQLLNQEPDLVVTATADSPAQALAVLEAESPQLLIVDISLRGGNGLELIKEVKEVLPGLPILVLSMHDESLYAERALRAGARGYVMKHESADKIIAAVRQVLSGRIAVSEAVSARLVGRMVGSSGAGGADPVETLSDRELEMLRLLGRGKATRAIAAEMKVGIKTVETYRARLKEKLQLRDSLELIRFAIDFANRQNQN